MIIAVMLTLSACQSPLTDSLEVLYVDSKLVDCYGVVPQQCLRVKSIEPARWELLHQGIDGFKYEAGKNYRLLVNSIQLKKPPQDSSSIRYELVKIIERH